MRSSRLLATLAHCAAALAFGVSGQVISSSANAADQPAGVTKAGTPTAGKNVAAAGRRVIEEMVVTSRRTEEKIQDVPVAVTAFNAEIIEQVAPRTLRDFDGLAPNVRIGMNTAGPSAGAIFIRGIGYADIEKTQSPAVSLIIDGVQQASSTGQLIDTFDVAQIEIDRGPQGVLQGKNTTGGAIVVNRIRPEFNKWDWNGALQYGTQNEQQVKARVNIPLINDTLALKIAGVHKTRDGFYKNLTLGGKVGDVSYNAASAALRWQPHERFSATLTYDYIKDDGDIPPQDPRYNGRNPFKNEANINEFQKYDVDGLTLNMDWDVGFGTLTSITGWQQANDTVRQDFDGSTRFANAVPLVQLHTLREQEFEQLSEELKLSGELFSRTNLHYIVGAFYWKTDLKFMQGTNLILQLPNFAGPTSGVPCAAFSGAGLGPSKNNPNPTIGTALCQFGPSYADHRAGEEVQSRALFGSLTWNVTDAIELSAGVRRLGEEKDFHTQFGTRKPPAGPTDLYGDPILPPTDIATVFPGFPVTANHGWGDTVSRISASWKFADAHNVYASYAQGFRSGGYSIRGTDTRYLAFDPETVDSYEIGSKNDFLDGRLRLNVAVFHTVLQGAQFSSILTTTALPGTNTLILNATGDYKVDGAEVEAVYALTDAISFRGTYGRQRTKGEGDEHSCLLRVYNNAAGTGCNTAQNPELFKSDGAGGFLKDPNGNPIPKGPLPVVKSPGGSGFASPKYNWAFVAAYDKNFGNNRFRADFIVRATDDVFLSALNGKAHFEPGYTLVDANISYQWNMADDRSLQLTLTGKNLTDKKYVEQELALGSGGFRGWGPPRQIALEALFHL